MDARIIELEATAVEMRAKRRLPEMLRSLEDALSLRISQKGGIDAAKDPEVQAAAEKLLKEYNTAAMSLLRAGAPNKLIDDCVLTCGDAIGSTQNAKSVLDKVRALLSA
jgi:phage-related tail protein